jgi:hypothetical protein
MKLHSLLVALATLTLFAAVAPAADVSGKWTAEVPGRQGAMQTTTFNFKVDGDKLTGTMAGPRGDAPITDGKVSGDDLSFTVSREMNGNTIKMNFTGKVSGGEIKFKRVVEGRDQTAEFTAKKSGT